MFEQKKIYKSLENRQFTPESLLKELEDLKKFDFEDVSYTGISLNMEMLMTQYLRNDNFELIEVQGGLAKKNYDQWQHDLALAINIFNHFAEYTKEYFHNYLEQANAYEKETGHSNTSHEFKEYFEQGNSMYFHDVLHLVFDLSRKLDLCIDDFYEALTTDGKDVQQYSLPSKVVFSAE
ncbi:hypothetical protein ACWOAH_06940 [Vagococcus vulneris]|uniref:Uncharacterized protein n=1 Tax=Vagococcus vulneris TaxID=1977869 RepID=A0A429ZYC5_9ENTE|nr:hypothetical protein [Vagococcus vulneris]RST98937.1 hypothetical protein CBF37_06095 [Vagococcus vulneris]